MPNLELEIRFGSSWHIAIRPGKLYTLRADLLAKLQLIWAEQLEAVAGRRVVRQLNHTLQSYKPAARFTKSGLQPSSALNQVNDHHDDGNYE
jgi:hypothetical protein